MSAQGITYQINGDEAVEHKLLGIAARGTNFEPVLTLIAGQMREAEAKRFDEGQGNWPPLADSTKAYKARHDLDPRILHATEAMRRSFTEESGDHVEMITQDELHFGSSDPKARFHQDGTSRMPQRRVMDFGEGEFRGWTREIQRYLVGADQAAMASAGLP